MLILIARMTPALSYLIPLFTVFQFLGLNNTLTALVITHLVITVPIVVYIMAGYFETLPRELEEAALIDGGSALAGASATSRCRWRGPGIVVGDDPRRSSSPGTTSSSARCWPAARRARCRSPSTTC